MRSTHFILFILPFTVLSCVSTGKYKAMQAEANKYDTLYTWSMRTLKTCQDANNDLNKQKVRLQNEANDTKLLLTATQDNNSQLRKQLQTLSALSSAQAESISKSLDNIGAKDIYLQELQAAIAHRDSVNLVLVMNLKATIGGFGEDVSIKVEKGFVYVDLSDKIIFSSDSNSAGYTVTNKAKTVLGRLARVLNDQPDLEFVVEGHTEGAATPQESLPDSLKMALPDSMKVSLSDSSNVALSDSSKASSPDSSKVAISDLPKVSLQDSPKLSPTDSSKAPSPDNWELSVKRATSIVRILQNDYHVSPQRITAAGRSGYIPVASNNTPEGRAANRRTRIVILPQMDHLLKVLERGPRKAGSM
ncbi:MAG TPA: OmpA family protein [Puia sp.]|nr:OmpA family protein [Puia sp.]